MGRLTDDMRAEELNQEENTTTSNVTSLHPIATSQQVRMLEALLFASREPLSENDMMKTLPADANIPALLSDLQSFYENRGVSLVKTAGKWAFRTADDLSFILRKQADQEKRLSRAAMETLAIIAYHQPVTRAEIEEVRGVSTSKGTLDALMEIGWIKMRGRRRTPGRPVTYGTTDDFMDHFGLEDLTDLPGAQELKGAGLLDSNLPPDFQVPQPHLSDDLTDDEDPLDEEDLIDFVGETEPSDNP